MPGNTGLDPLLAPSATLNVVTNRMDTRQRSFARNLLDVLGAFLAVFAVVLILLLVLHGGQPPVQPRVVYMP